MNIKPTVIREARTPEEREAVPLINEGTLGLAKALFSIPEPARSHVFLSLTLTFLASSGQEPQELWDTLVFNVDAAMPKIIAGRLDA